MNVRLIASISGGLLVLGFLGFRAWNTWPPLGRYRIKRNQALMRAVAERYLKGQVALDSAATEVANGMRREMLLGWAVPDTPGAGSLTALAVTITPPGYSPADPRISQLEQRSFMLFVGPDRYNEIQERIRSRGDRSNRPPQSPPPR